MVQHTKRREQIGKLYTAPCKCIDLLVTHPACCQRVPFSQALIAAAQLTVSGVASENTLSATSTKIATQVRSTMDNWVSVVKPVSWSAHITVPQRAWTHWYIGCWWGRQGSYVETSDLPLRSFLTCSDQSIESDCCLPQQWRTEMGQLAIVSFRSITTQFQRTGQRSLLKYLNSDFGQSFAQLEVQAKYSFSLCLCPWANSGTSLWSFFWPMAEKSPKAACHCVPWSYQHTRNQSRRSNKKLWEKPWRNMGHMVLLGSPYPWLFHAAKIPNQERKVPIAQPLKAALKAMVLLQTRQMHF